MNLTPSLPHRFAAYIHQHQLFHATHRLLVAVSGGLDSVVLCHLLHLGGYSFAVVHCHFGLRGAESDRDAYFTEQIAATYKVPFFLKHFNTETYATEHRLSTQEAARKLRYDWFAELMQQRVLADHDAVPSVEASVIEPQEAISNSASDFARLLTAHHLDDNIETVVMNFFKGTGISGLRGMLPRQGYLVRPLLFARRKDLEAYAAENSLQWVEDSSNAATKYTRNFFRHEVLPLIGQKFPQVLENIGSSISRFAEIEQLYVQAVDTHRRNLLEYRGEEVHIPVLKLVKTKPLETVLFEILKPYGFSPQQTTTVLQLAHSESGRYVQSATHQVLRHRRWLVIAPLQPKEASIMVVERDTEQVAFGDRLLRIKQRAVPKSLLTDADTALMDSRLLQFPLLLRRWKAGDYFYPLGLGKKKKVARLLVDLKLSRSEKEQVWVLESGKKIAWVVGLRLDDRFKVTPATKQVMQFTAATNPGNKPEHSL